nr:MAG TPA: hypothetical protein [Caudoviricetes sp.]
MVIDLAARRTANAKVPDKPVKKETQKYSKEQILASARFAGRRDLVDALLEKDKSYTLETVKNMITKYLKGQVK